MDLNKLISGKGIINYNLGSPGMVGISYGDYKIS